MKKYFKYFLFVLLGIGVMNVKAATFTTSIAGSTGITAGGTITLTFKATSAIPLLGIRATLNYDANKLELVSSTAGSGFNLTVGSKIVADASVGKSGTFTYATIKFKAKSSFVIGESTTVSLSNVTGSDGSTTLNGSTSKITIKMKSTDNTLSSLKIDAKEVSGFKASTTSYRLILANNVDSVNITATPNSSSASIKGTGVKKLNIYANKFNIVVTSESGSAKTYTLTIIRLDKDGLSAAQSTNNTLKELTIEGYEIDFDSSTTEYELKVKNEVEKLNITATPNDSKSKVTVENKDLVVGLNEIIINVEAENGSINKYVLKIKRLDDNPQVPINEFLEISKTTTKETIEVLISKNQIISKDELLMIKNSGKNVIFSYYEDEKLVYAYSLKNADILTDTEFDTTLKFSSAKQSLIEEQTNYAEAVYLSSNNSNKSISKLKVFINNFNKNTNLYTFSDKIVFQEELEIKDGYVEFGFLDNDYFISRMVVKKTQIGIWPIILGIENILIAGFCIYLIIKKSVKNNRMEKQDEKEIIQKS